MLKPNCWESMKCGREPGGEKVAELGPCPAATETRLDGANGGRNGGRACWAIVGTMCGGVVRGTFASKLDNCLQCEFYRHVRQDDPETFMHTALILQRLSFREPPPRD